MLCTILVKVPYLTLNHTCGLYKTYLPTVVVISVVMLLVMSSLLLAIPLDHQ